MASSATRDEFPAFPFDPYPVQLRFMKETYAALQKGGITIAESPTGTGKTLSLICSVLQWLQDRKLSEGSGVNAESLRSIQAEDSVDVESEPQWLRDFRNPNSENDQKDAGKNIKKRAFNSKVLNISSGKKDQQSDLSYKESENVPSQDQDQEEEAFLLDDYDSDNEYVGKTTRKRKAANASGGSSDEEFDLEEEDEENEQPIKVFFCSRTHSQLSQFVKELQKTVFSSSLRAVTLGSRKSLCINPDVQRLEHPSRINERCLELQRNRNNPKAASKLPAKKSRRGKVNCGGCPFMKKRSLQRMFKEHAWESEVLDVEDLVQLGQGLGTCPYYGSRQLIPSADLVIMPYQSLLHYQTRESLGVKLDGCVVVIDEAHNLVDSISNMYSCQISFSQLNQVKSLLSMYLSRFKAMLSAGNRRYIQTLLILIEAFLNRLTANDKSTELKEGNETVEMLTINDFLFSLNIDNINMFKLCEYMKSSKIIHKVCGYSERLSSKTESSTITNKGAIVSSDEWSGSFTSFHALAELILTLMMADSDGRILVHSHSGNHQGQAYVKFIMLNAAQAFSEVIEKTQAVVLAGGTLQPIEELEYRLYPQLKKDQIHFFSCGHIVPPENVLALGVAHGPTGRTFDFTYQSRAHPEMIEELGRLLFNLSLVVPEGMVVFLPSFEYEHQLHSAWKSAGILDKIQRKKYLFREPRDATSVDVILRNYKEAVTDTQKNLDSGRTGAIILCVVGGKMSEGINFSDGMGRCVIMVGLPYPSLSDPELVERMKYVDMVRSVPTDKIPEFSKLEENARLAGYNGRTYYENLCMKAVNQSIGRAIRHIKDYAAIVLVDARYTSQSSIASGPTSKLPSWIKEQLIIATGNFGEVHKQIHHFFRKKQGMK